MIVSFFKYIGIIFISFFVTGTMLLIIPIDYKNKMYTYLSYIWASSILFVCGINVKSKNLENLSSLEKSVVVSNHASMFDIIALFKIFPEIKFMYKKELAKIPIWGWALKFGPHIGVNRKKGIDAMRSIDESIDAIKNKGHIVLFAEGTRTLDGNLQNFKRGAFLLASKSGLPIVPLTINGTYGIKPKNSWKILKSNVELIFHNSIHKTPNSRAEELELMEQTHKIISNDYVGVLQ